LKAVLLEGPGLPPPLAVPYDIDESENWNATTPRFVLEWTVLDDAMLYASAARGFKSGGFQGTAGTAASAATPYDPEYAWAYELGAKTEWFDGLLRANLAVFRIEHEDLQVSQLVPLCCVVIGNAAKAEIEGWELEVVTRPVDRLDVNLSYAALDAEFDDFATGATADFTGNTFVRPSASSTSASSIRSRWVRSAKSSRASTGRINRRSSSRRRIRRTRCKAATTFSTPESHYARPMSPGSLPCGVRT
jgi:iron complex outermembrane receptor protein